MSRRAARCTQADIRRVLKAAEASGRLVEIAIDPDGTIRLIPIKAESANVPLGEEGEIVL